MKTKELLIRKAYSTDAPLLTSLAMRSKAHWGYSVEYMNAFRPELQIKSEWILSNPTFVAISHGHIVGFAGLLQTDDPHTGELYYLFITPECIGFGYGKNLWDRCLEECKNLKWTSLVIHSDPNAEAFYKKLGAVRIGEKPYPSIPGRMSPLLKYEIPAPVI